MMLYDALREYCASDVYPFHMPGHKRRQASMCDPAAIDITEIDGFDNLHHAEGIIRHAEMRAASLYGSGETHFLVNGSTSGVLSAVCSAVQPGGLLLMARNCHRSAYNAAALNNLRTIYLYPGQYTSHYGQISGLYSAPRCAVNGPVTPGSVEDSLSRNPGINAVFLTSPTYDGVVSDIAAIAQTVHRHGIPLIVDEAHGAHFGMHRIFPPSSVSCGADLVIHSLHKTLPALTQTALIHVNGPLIDRARLRRMLGTFQTSSPSYVLMSSADQCIRLLSLQGAGLFDAYAKRLKAFYGQFENNERLKHLSFIRTDDPSRIIISPRGVCSGVQLYHKLRKCFHLQPEMAAPSYVLMLSSVCDDDEGFSRLTRALKTLDREFGTRNSSGRNIDFNSTHSEDRIRALSSGTFSQAPEAICTISDALNATSEEIPFSESAGRISAEFLFMYPPGVPLLVPGERITPDIITEVLALKKEGFSLQGTDDFSLEKIKVMDKNHNPD